MTAIRRKVGWGRVPVQLADVRYRDAKCGKCVVKNSVALNTPSGGYVGTALFSPKSRTFFPVLRRSSIAMAGKLSSLLRIFYG
jgi:hypothetical protein